MKKNPFGKIGKIIFAFYFAVFGCNFVFALELYKADAVVSFYGDAFHGKQTSSGEKYNMNDLTCANKSLPFGTVLKITNLANGKSVQVRVNDRGPFVSGRECDLSKAAAQKIDMIGSGTAHVKIEFVKKTEHSKLSLETAEAAEKLMKKKEGNSNNSDKSNSTAAKTDTDSRSKTYEIQIGAYKDKSNANQTGNQIINLGITDVVLRKYKDIYRVTIKNISEKDLPKIEKKLRSNGFKDFIVKEL